MSGPIRTVHVRIEGRVQGVSYRAWTERKATELGLNGWVRNRSDGSVEAVFQGAPATVDAMIDACRRGPSAAVVKNLAVEEEEAGPFAGFDVLSTL